MNNFPPDSIAMRRELVVGLIAFVVGFVAMLAALAWVIVRFVVPEAHWWDVAHMCIHATWISLVFGGLGFAALCVWTLSWYHHMRGYYLCPYCKRPLKGVTTSCDCPEVKALGR